MSLQKKFRFESDRPEIFEIQNDRFEICPGCGCYQGQFHDPRCCVMHELMAHGKKASLGRMIGIGLTEIVQPR